MNIDSATQKVKKYKKYQDFWDFKSFECLCSLLGAIITTVLFFLMLKKNDIGEVIDLWGEIAESIATELIGYLGFTVAGLAILTGIISQKILSKISRKRKNENLEKILLSFHFLGIIIAIEMLFLFWVFFLTTTNLRLFIPVAIILCFILTYTFCFILFYSVRLIGCCLEIFFIVNGAEDEVDEKYLFEIYSSYRVTALERILLSKQGPEDLEKYKKIILEQCEAGIYPEEMKSYAKEQWGEVDK